MSNLMNFFGSGGGGGSVPLMGLTEFPFDSPIKVVRGNEVYIRSGYSEAVDFDPSLQEWVDDNIMFVNTQSLPSSETVNATRGVGVGTDGTGKWMAAGYAASAAHSLPKLYYSADDGVSWTPMAIPITTNGHGVLNVKSGGNGVWIIRAGSGSFSKLYRTADDGQTWADISTAAAGGASNIVSYDTDGNGVWIATLGNAATFARKSIDNGATWSQTGLASISNAFVIKYGGGDWVVCTTDPNTTTGWTSLMVSSNAGVSWTTHALGVTAQDYVYCQGNWVLFLTYQTYIRGVDWTKWNAVVPRYQDTFTDYYSVGSIQPILSCGMDGSLWVSLYNVPFRSTDLGTTWLRYDHRTSFVMSGPNKRAVCVTNSVGAAGLPIGIATGRPAAGCMYSNVGRQVQTGDIGRRSAYYMRVR